MKPALIFLAFFALFAACSLPAVSTPNTVQPKPALTYTPPPEALTLDACAFTVNYPNVFVAEESGWYVWFTPAAGEPIQVFVQARRRNEAEADLSARDLLARLAQNNGAPAAYTTKDETLTDSTGAAVPAAQTDFVTEGQHYRLLVAVRPDTLLGDLAPDDVIYELTAQTPEDIWPKWAAYFELIFFSIQPKDCGGV